MQAPQDHFIQVGPIKTRYWAEGSGGGAVILIHGWSEFIESWLLNVSALTPHYRVYALDLPGHGRTDKPPHMSYQASDFARFIREFMATFHIKHASLVGHSLGGAIALQFALQFPGLIDKLILVDIAGLGKELTFLLRLASIVVLGDLLSRRPSRGSLAYGLKLTVKDPALITEEWIELAYQMAAQPGAQRAWLKTLRGICNLLGQHPCFVNPIVNGLTSLRCPTLIMWGQHDRIVPVTHAQVAATGIMNARLRIFEQCGHNPMLEQTSAFNQALLEFLRS